MNTATKTRRPRLSPANIRDTRRAERQARIAAKRAERQAAAEAKADALAAAPIPGTMTIKPDTRNVWRVLRGRNVANIRRGYGDCVTTGALARELEVSTSTARKHLYALQKAGFVVDRGRTSRASWHVVTDAEKEAAEAADAKRKDTEATLAALLGCDTSDVIVKNSGGARLDLSGEQVAALVARLEKLAAIEAITG